ncbi:MAG TPA: acyl-CoA dehydrogenase family protein [Actinomycetota bacterium]|nr:acyl-CoA dehydrogenase family protein [Actinomycetota bacterium]
MTIEALREEARAFLAEHVPAWKADEGVGDEELTREQRRSWQRHLFEHGWGVPTWPEEYGGRGLGMVENLVWNQCKAEAGFQFTFDFVGMGLAGPTIIARGTERQKQRYLKPIARGDESWCQLFSEPGAGSDLGGLSTRAERSGDVWIVNGQKVWSSGAMESDFGLLIARHDPDLPKQQGLVFLLLDMHAPGVEIRPLRQIDGGAHFAEVFFNDVEVPDADRVGEPGEGWSVAMTTLLHERSSIGGGIGSFAMPFDDVVRIAREHGRNEDPLVRQHLVEIYTRKTILDVLNTRVQTALLSGRIPEAEGSVIKLLMAQLGSVSALNAIELLGVEGTLADGPGSPQQRFLGMAALHIGGGTDEVQRNAIAERVLGLPREPRPDKEVPFKDTRR